MTQRVATSAWRFEGDRPAIFWTTLPPSGFQNGRYKVETSMLYSGEQKDQKSATFDVIGY